MRSVQLTISGRVQGVGFRAWTADQARRRGLTGWVRNRADGSVEARIAGAVEAVELMVSACRQGPSHAAVSHVEVIDAPEPVAAGFAVLPTA